MPNPDYSIRLDLLTPSETRRLTELGVELLDIAAAFDRKLSANEMREVWHILADLYSRTGDDDNHINFAIGDWAIKAGGWFGEEQMEQWVEEYNFLLSFRDHILKLAGATLVHLQSLEALIKVCLHLLGINGGTSDLLSSDAKVRKRTLGQLVGSLRNSQLFDDPFESRLADFVKDRNKFVHSYWSDLSSKYSVEKFRSKAVMQEVETFLTNLFRTSIELERIFQGL